MATLTWGDAGERVYEAGLSRGVLYPALGSPVVWNGLISVDETRSSGAPTPYYIDGVKYYDSSIGTDFVATLKAHTYPDEFGDFDGVASFEKGMYFDQQTPTKFGLSYQTKIGNDTEGLDHGYKIHILYNLMASPTNRNYESLSNQTKPVDFSWDLSGVPEVVTGFKPTAHVVFDSRKVPPRLMGDIKDILYGTSTTPPRLPPLQEFADLVDNWTFISIVDNGDGTWTAESKYEGVIEMIDSTTFVINYADAVYLDADTYTIQTSFLEAL